MYGVTYRHDETISTTIETASGVDELGQPAGTVTIESPEGSTSVRVTVDDRQGNQVTVYLDWHQVAMVLVNLGAAAREL